MTETTKTYNGWTNYETWNVALWLGNDEGSSRQCDAMAQDAWDEAVANRSFTREERATLNLADQLKEMVEEGNPLASEASMFSDLLSGALSEVNWMEIARNLMENTDKTDEDEDDEEDEEEDSDDEE